MIIFLRKAKLLYFPMWAKEKKMLQFWWAVNFIPILLWSQYILFLLCQIEIFLSENFMEKVLN